MVCRVSIAQLAEILTVPLPAVPEGVLTALGTGIATDTRTLEGGEVFLALRGDNFDGHQFVAKARNFGAIAAVVDRDWQEELPDFPLLRVDDTLKAYQSIAAWWRHGFSIPIVAVTGSVGKTTVKELIAAVLSTRGNVLKTQYNYNNEIGVPKTLLELSPSHNYAVIEMGMRGMGGIALLSQIARGRSIAVITNVGTAHIGRLGSEEAIAQAKCELLAEMPAESIAILDEDHHRLMASAAKVWPGKTLTYGLEGGDLCGELLNNDTILLDGMELPLPLPGRHNAVNYLAALAVGKVLGIDWEVLKQGLSVQLPEGRGRRWISSRIL